jgi:hypothetical protein
MSGQREVRLARLHTAQISSYEALHAGLPALNRRGLEDGGFTAVTIWRCGEHLVMLTERDPALERASNPEVLEAGAAWEQVTGDCFASTWQDAALVFGFERKMRDDG